MTAPSNDPVLWTARRLAMRLREAGIPYAMMGALAFHAYGARRMRDAVEVLLTPQGLDLFRQRLVGEHYEPVPERSRRFVERRSGTPMEAFLTGHSPGRRGPTPFAFPDPGEDSEEVAGACIL